MIIRLLPNQIPNFWEAIKFAINAVERPGEEGRQDYFLKLLIDLLNDKAQCFIEFDEMRRLQGIAVTKVTQDGMTGQKSLLILCLYTFQLSSIDRWRDRLEHLVTFARNMGCKKIISYSSSQRVFEIAQAIGFTESFRCHILSLGA